MGNAAAARNASEAVNHTKENLLDAAEVLFAEHGVAGASLRAITARAGVNLAAAHYHFGSKEALLRAVMARRLRPINARRLALLDAYEAQPAAERSLVELLRAFVDPVVRFGRELPDEGRAFAQLCGRAMNAPDDVLRSILIDELGEVVRRFLPAFARALPALPRRELLWRVHFTVGAMAHAMAGRRLIEAVSGGLCDTRDVDGTVERLVRFLAAGFAAPAAEDSP
ncbi:MAG: TetR/AcrR family transcriptional regulator [Acidobacteria bacterium]|nr:MAG: TetR/AcrR family transcriptional regulator [Acidobacteriota bacterium]